MAWPPFMLEDPVADVWFGRLPEVFGEYQLVALDAGGRVVGKVNSIPFAWSGQDDDLPARGWDAILERGFAEQARGIRPTAVSLLQARVIPEVRGEGLSALPLEAAVADVRRLGLRDLFGPDVPGALVPVHVSVENDHAVYVEPNVRVHHPVAPA